VSSSSEVCKTANCYFTICGPDQIIASGTKDLGRVKPPTSFYAGFDTFPRANVIKRTRPATVKAHSYPRKWAPSGCTLHKSVPLTFKTHYVFMSHFPVQKLQHFLPWLLSNVNINNNVTAISTSMQFQGAWNYCFSA
jgi:hypothetical protein